MTHTHTHVLEYSTISIIFPLYSDILGTTLTHEGIKGHGTNDIRVGRIIFPVDHTREKT